MTEPNYRSCPSHCCPKHGCKYGYGVWQPGECPVASGEVEPTYPPNNGCEQCADVLDTIADLERYEFNEPLRPVSEYCDALRDYAYALHKCAAEGEAGPFSSAEEAESIADALDKLDVWSMKSNLLYRLIYLKQDLRTRKCPVHKGRWAGYGWTANECECQVGLDITGWLPNE